MFNIKDIIVNRISLISRWKKPAVPKAETTFSIFKSAKKSLITKEHIKKLEKIKEKYEKDIEKKENKDNM